PANPPSSSPSRVAASLCASAAAHRCTRSSTPSCAVIVTSLVGRPPNIVQPPIERYALNAMAVVDERPGTRSGAPISLVDAEHALGYSGDLDLAPDRAPLREFVVAPQRGEAAQPAGPARVRRVG